MSDRPRPTLNLAFEGFRAGWRGHSLGPLTAAVTSPRLALVGAWSAFTAHLAGVPDAVASGSVTLEGAPLRELIKSGRVGVVRAEQTLPSALTVGSWLSDCLMLGGASAAAADRQVRRELEGRGLGFLRTRLVRELSASESFAAQLAFGLLGEPQWALLPAPRVQDALRPFCQRLLDEAARSCQVAVVFDGEPELELLRWCDYVLAAQNGSLTTQCSVATWLAQALHYRLRPSAGTPTDSLDRDAPSLETRLREQGVVVHNPGQKQLLLSLPSPGATDRVLRACQDAALGVRELTPLFFAPTAS